MRTHPDIDFVSPAELADMRQWLADSAWTGLDLHQVADLSDRQVTDLIEANYLGLAEHGVWGFLRDRVL